MNSAPADNKVLETDYNDVSGLTEPDRELLIEYQKLAKNLGVLSSKLGQLTSGFTGNILDDVQSVESKVSLVYTLMQAAVYNVFVQNDGEFVDEDENAEEEQQEDGTQAGDMGDQDDTRY